MASKTVQLIIEAMNARAAARDVDRVSRSVRQLGDESGRSSVSARKLNAHFSLVVRNMLKLIRPAGQIAAFGGLAQGMSAASAGAVALGGALAPLAGTGAAAAGGMLAAGQGMGVLKFATLGVTQAVGGLNKQMDPKKLAALTPPAQEFAKHLNSLKAPVRALQASLQRGMFPGFTQGLSLASGALGVLRRGLAPTAVALGGIGVKVGAFVRAVAASGDLGVILRRNAKLITLMGTGAINLANTFRHVIMAAGPLTMWLGRLVNGWTEALSVQANVARSNGTLAAFFDRTREALSSVFSIAGSVAKSFWNIAKAGAPLGRELLKSIDKNAAAFARWTGSADGRNKIAAFFERAKPVIYEAGKLIRDVVKAFGGLSQQPGLARMIRQIRTDLLPVLVRVADSTAATFGPVLVDAVVAFAKAFEPLAGSSGPLVLALQGLTTFAKAVTWIGQNVPGATQAMSLFFGALAVNKAVGVVSAVTGVGKLGKVFNAAAGTKIGTSFVGGLAQPFAAIKDRMVRAAQGARLPFVTSMSRTGTVAGRAAASTTGGGLADSLPGSLGRRSAGIHGNLVTFMRGAARGVGLAGAVMIAAELEKGVSDLLPGGANRRSLDRPARRHSVESRTLDPSRDAPRRARLG